MPGPADERARRPQVQRHQQQQRACSARSPTSPTAGTLTFTPATDANGTATITVEVQDNGGTANGGVDTVGVRRSRSPSTRSTTRRPSPRAPTRRCSRTPVRRPSPTGPTGISAGPPNESGQTLTLQRHHATATALFGRRQPGGRRSTGTLTYTPAAERQRHRRRSRSPPWTTAAPPTAAIDTSAAADLHINVTAVNDAPSFTQGQRTRPSLEDAGAQTVSRLGDRDLSRTRRRERPDARPSTSPATATPSLFSARPAVATDRHPDLHPGGRRQRHGHDHGRRSRTTAAPPTAASTPRHRRPSRSPSPRSTTRRRFTKGPDQTVQRGRRPADRHQLGHRHSSRPANESSQTRHLQRHRQRQQPALFSVQPGDQPRPGTLTYTPAADANGSATITVTSRTTAERANGGVDTSVAADLHHHRQRGQRRAVVHQGRQQDRPRGRRRPDVREPGPPASIPDPANETGQTVLTYHRQQRQQPRCSAPSRRSPPTAR